jgi:hypothetical protein
MIGGRGEIVLDSALLTLIVIIVSLIAFALAAMRYGVDSRHTDDRPNWW